jgi:hypothetical protein
MLFLFNSLRGALWNKPCPPEPFKSSEAFKIHPKRFAPYSTKGMFREQKIEVSEKIFGPDLISLALGAVRKTPTDSEKSQLPSRSSLLHKALRRKR